MKITKRGKFGCKKLQHGSLSIKSKDMQKLVKFCSIKSNVRKALGIKITHGSWYVKVPAKLEIKS